MRLFRIIQTRLLGFLALVALAELVAVIAGRPARADCRVSIIAKLPVTMVGWRPLVPAKINGVDATFFVHSGSSFSSISSAAAVQYQLEKEPINYNVAVEGLGKGLMSLTKIKKFEIAGKIIDDLLFIVGGGEVGGGASGRIGQDILGGFDTDYDLGHGAVSIVKPENCRHEALTYWGGLYTELPMEYSSENHFSIVRVIVNGTPLRAIFNTGSKTSWITPSAAMRAGIKKTTPNLNPNEQSKGSVKTFQIGEEKILNTLILIGSGESDIDIYLGLDFFLAHNILISNTQHKVFITYNGGPVFDLHPVSIPQQLILEGGTPGAEGTISSDRSALSPTDADGFSRQGSAFAARLEYDKAIADFTRAVELAPNNSEYVYQRAIAYIGAKQPDTAMADLNTAIKLNPVYANALIVRANQRRLRLDLTGERADLNAVSDALPKAANLRLDLVNLYLASDDFGQAITELDNWIKAFPDDSRQAFALNQRCWTRALADRELEVALSDCNAALHRSPNASYILDSRGLVRLRRGEFARAISDYDAALKRNPKIAWSLYGRGLAELKTGDADKGRSDIAAAVAIAPKLPERAGKLGLTPEAFAATSTVASTPASPTVH